jgi:hypothetical protein
MRNEQEIREKIEYYRGRISRQEDQYPNADEKDIAKLDLVIDRYYDKIMALKWVLGEAGESKLSAAAKIESEMA